jgi:hypothetical protein
MSEIGKHECVEVFVGLDVGKGTHHAVALDRKGKRLLDSALPNDESKLRALIGQAEGTRPGLGCRGSPVAVAQAEDV